MHRLPDLEHHVVGDVDHRGQGAYATPAKAFLHPQRTLRGRIDTSNDPANVARTALGRVEHNGQHVAHPGLDRRRAPAAFRRHTVRDGDFTREPLDAKAIAAVGSDAHFDGDVIQCQALHQIHAGRCVGIEFDDSTGILAEPQLPCGAQHALRQLSANPALPDLQTIGETRPGGSERRAQTGAHIGRAAHDTSGLAAAVVDLAELKPLGTGVRRNSDDFRDADKVHCSGDRLDGFHLEAHCRQLRDERIGIDRWIDPFANPAFAEFHPRSPAIS